MSGQATCLYCGEPIPPGGHATRCACGAHYRRVGDALRECTICTEDGWCEACGESRHACKHGGAS